MIILLGILDLVAALMFVLLYFGVLTFLGWIFGVYLIVKGIYYFSWMGALDILSGVLMILGVFGIWNFFSLFAFIWLVQKGVFSCV